MKDNKEILMKLKASLKNSLNSFLKFAASDMTQVTTDDGTTLSVDGDVAIGTSVYEIDDNANLTPCPNGDYTLDSGQVITVADGKITTIAGDPSNPQDDTTSPDDEMAKEEMADAPASPATPPADATAPASDTTDLETRVTNLEDAVNQIIQMLSDSTSMSKQTMGAIEKIAKQVEAIEKEPATNAIRVKKVGLGSEKAMSEIDRINEIAKRLKK